MRFDVGTSGYAYAEWKGSFYPEKLPKTEMLSYYGQHFATVEINNSFYRMPDKETLTGWAAQVPETFRFVIKAPQTITHRKRLREVENETKELIETTAVLKKRLGPLFFQLPPNFKKDLGRLEAFLSLVGKQARTTFEFRHESWFDEETYACLREHSSALCWADTDESEANPTLVATTDWGYIRLRRTEYSDAALRAWKKRLSVPAWKHAYIFFKHEDTGTAPKFGSRLLELIGS